MRKILLTLIGSFCLATGVHAQVSDVITDDKKATVIEHEARLAAGQSLTVFPNPVKSDFALLTIQAIGVEIYSYKMLDATGAIVELENLSGRPDISTLDLNGVVIEGMYYIVFETNVGKITRKVMVI